jgi:hypothetical protein
MGLTTRKEQLMKAVECIHSTCTRSKDKFVTNLSELYSSYGISTNTGLALQNLGIITKVKGARSRYVWTSTATPNDGMINDILREITKISTTYTNKSRPASTVTSRLKPIADIQREAEKAGEAKAFAKIAAAQQLASGFGKTLDLSRLTPEKISILSDAAKLLGV